MTDCIFQGQIVQLVMLRTVMKTMEPVPTLHEYLIWVNLLERRCRQTVYPVWSKQSHLSSSAMM